LTCRPIDVSADNGQQVVVKCTSST